MTRIIQVPISIWIKKREKPKNILIEFCHKNIDIEIVLSEEQRCELINKLQKIKINKNEKENTN